MVLKQFPVFVENSQLKFFSEMSYVMIEGEYVM